MGWLWDIIDRSENKRLAKQQRERQIAQHENDLSLKLMAEMYGRMDQRQKAIEQYQGIKLEPGSPDALNLQSLVDAQNESSAKFNSLRDFLFNRIGAASQAGGMGAGAPSGNGVQGKTNYPEGSEGWRASQPKPQEGWEKDAYLSSKPTADMLFNQVEGMGDTNAPVESILDQTPFSRQGEVPAEIERLKKEVTNTLKTVADSVVLGAPGAIEKARSFMKDYEKEAAKALDSSAGPLGAGIAEGIGRMFGTTDLQEAKSHLDTIRKNIELEELVNKMKEPVSKKDKEDSSSSYLKYLRSIMEKKPSTSIEKPTKKMGEYQPSKKTTKRSMKRYGQSSGEAAWEMLFDKLGKSAYDYVDGSKSKEMEEANSVLEDIQRRIAREKQLGTLSRLFNKPDQKSFYQDVVSMLMTGKRGGL